MRPVLTRALPPPKRSGIYFWNMAGSLCNAAKTVVMTLIITRLCGVETAGVYSLSLAVAQMVQPVAMFEVRNFQVSDAKNEYSFSEYHLLRLFTVLAAMLFTCAWVLARGYTGEKLAAVVLTCAMRIFEAYEDLFQGLLQRNGRLDVSGKSFSLRIVINTVLFGVVLALTRDFLFCLLCNTLFVGAWVLLVTVPAANSFEKPHMVRADRIPQLARACVPLFLTSLLISYMISAPKYAIDEFYPSGLQTYFSFLFMPASVVNLFTLVMYRLLLTRMAEDWTRGNMRAFLRAAGLLTGWIFLVGGAALAAGWFWGIPVLEWISGISGLKDCRAELMIVMTGGIFAALAGWFSVVLTVMRRQKILLLYSAAAAGALWCFVRPMVRAMALRGAAYSYLIAMALFASLQFVSVLRSIVCACRGAASAVGKNRGVQ